jgi:hypothetical protein
MPTPYVTDGRGDQDSCLPHVRVVPSAAPSSIGDGAASAASCGNRLFLQKIAGGSFR